MWRTSIPLVFFFIFYFRFFGPLRAILDSCSIQYVAKQRIKNCGDAESGNLKVSSESVSKSEHCSCSLCSLLFTFSLTDLERDLDSYCIVVFRFGRVTAQCTAITDMVALQVASSEWSPPSVLNYSCSCPLPYDFGPTSAPGVFLFFARSTCTRLASEGVGPLSLTHVQHRVPPFLAISSQSLALRACCPVQIPYPFGW